jgi:O-antigen ligase
MTCAVLCSALILVMKVPALRKTIKSLGAYVAIIAFLLVLLQAFGLMEVIIAKFAVMVGRDPTLHGRTQIWQALLSEDMNPLIGEGYYSFWSMGRMKKLSEKYYYLINEAHNGYIESYLNTGLLGLSLLIAFLVSSANTIKKYILAGVSYGSLRFAFLVSSIFYGVSEAVFNRLSFLWMVLLLSSMEYPAATPVEVPAEPEGKPAESGPELGPQEAGPAPI